MLKNDSNLAFALSPVVDDVLEGLRSFVETEVVGRHERYRAILDEKRAAQ